MSMCAHPHTSTHVTCWALAVFVALPGLLEEAPQMEAYTTKIHSFIPLDDQSPKSKCWEGGSVRSEG